MTVEELYQLGLMPENAYYQLNGKSAEENYRHFKNKQSYEFINSILNRRQIESALTETIEPVLNDLLSTFEKSGNNKNISFKIGL